MCYRKRGTYLINSTFCGIIEDKTILLTATGLASTVIILIDPQDSREHLKCSWTYQMPRYCKAVLTMDRPLSDKENLLVEVSNTGLCVEKKCELARDVSGHLDSGGNVTFYKNDGFISVSGHRPLSVPFVVFRIVAQPNVLLTGPASGNAQYLTLPMIDGLHPTEYEGYFLIVNTNNSVIVVKFIFFYTIDDHLEIKKAVNGTGRAVLYRLQGDLHYIPVRHFKHPILIQFCSNRHHGFGGFKLNYIRVPSFAEPQHVEVYTYNCSVPYYHWFIDVFRCDLIRDCAGQEDESGCDVYSKVCRGYAIEAGEKCIYVLHPNMFISWTEAQALCSQNQYRFINHFQQTDFANTLSKMQAEYGVFRFYVGVQLKRDMSSVHLSGLYRNVWRWTDRSSAFLPHDSIESHSLPYCAYLSRDDAKIQTSNCFKRLWIQVVCEFEKDATNRMDQEQLDNPSLTTSRNYTWPVNVVQCPTGHVSRDFLSCDVGSKCGERDLRLYCPVANKQSSMFACDNGAQTLSYTLVCDHVSHCNDFSDENFCRHSKCSHRQFECGHQQCVFLTEVCDGKIQCYDQSDEMCSSPLRAHSKEEAFPIMVDIDDTGFVNLRTSHACPQTHFLCSEQFCLPMYMRCNGIADCAYREDEEACDLYTCRGYYRCRSSDVCLHPDHVCDSVVHCPDSDDELACHNFTCPDECLCQGLVFICAANFPIRSYPQVRYLDVSGFQGWSESMADNVLLIRVSLSNTALNTVPLLDLPNLQHLDLSHNNILAINMQSLRNLVSLKVLSLSNNPLREVSNVNSSRLFLVDAKNNPLVYNEIAKNGESFKLQKIDFSQTAISSFDGNYLIGFHHVKYLNMSLSRLHTVSEEGFSAVPKLEVLDVRGSPLNHFPHSLLRTLDSLRIVYSDNPLLCCEKMLPINFDSESCHTSADLLASCEDLLKKSSFRIFLWIFSALSVLGNISSFVGRIFLRNQSGSQGSFHIFVIALTVADFCMGIYLTIIGIADLVYRGEYLWQANKWKTSVFCEMAGFFSLMSTEVSAFVICLITLDRFLVLCFPFSSIHFSRRSALRACACVWVSGIILAAVPLLPVTSHWHFYQQTGICIPLPFAPSDGFQGHSYSLAVLIILNFVLFMLIAVGQAVIYWSVQKNSLSTSRQAGSRDTVIVLRLTTVVMSDFLCWFPVGVLGLLASAGTPIPPEVNVAVVIFVLPINSALNPFLYTINTLMEKRRRAREIRLMESLQESCKPDEMGSLLTLVHGNRDSTLAQIQGWLRKNIVTGEEVLACYATNETQ